MCATADDLQSTWKLNYVQKALMKEKHVRFRILLLICDASLCGFFYSLIQFMIVFYAVYPHNFPKSLRFNLNINATNMRQFRTFD